MNATEAMKNADLRRLVEELKAAPGGGLHSVVLYGSAARDDFHEKTSDLNLIVVLAEVSPAALEAVAPAIRKWAARGQPMPRLFTPALIADSADVFPIEMLDLQGHRVVLEGADPFAGLTIGRANLRLQCERELRAKLMRLREGYLECHDRPKELALLLTASYTTFAALFRGCLYLVGAPAPARNSEVVAAFCRRAGIEPRPFEAVDRLKRGEAAGEDLKGIFSRYHEQLSRVVDTIDRFQTEGGETR